MSEIWKAYFHGGLFFFWGGGGRLLLEFYSIYLRVLRINNIYVDHTNFLILIL